MAEMLVWVADKETSGDEKVDALSYKRGDVIVVCEDGWVWSQTELSHPSWLVIKLPGMRPSTLNGITDIDKSGEVLRAKRAHGFDLDAPLAQEVILGRTSSVEVSTDKIDAFLQLRVNKDPGIVVG